MKKAKLKAPKCEECKPEILPENQIAVGIYCRCATGEGVRPEALESTMRIFNVDRSERAEVADKVLIMAGQQLKHARKKREKENAESRNRLCKHSRQA